MLVVGRKAVTGNAPLKKQRGGAWPRLVSYSGTLSAFAGQLSS